MVIDTSPIYSRKEARYKREMVPVCRSLANKNGRNLLVFYKILHNFLVGLRKRTISMSSFGCYFNGRVLVCRSFDFSVFFNFFIKYRMISLFAHVIYQLLNPSVASFSQLVNAVGQGKSRI